MASADISLEYRLARMQKYRVALVVWPVYRKAIAGGLWVALQKRYQAVDRSAHTSA